MATKKIKTPATARAAIQSQEEFHKSLEEVVTNKNKAKILDARFKVLAEKLKKRYSDRINTALKEAELMQEACELYASTRKAELFGKNKSTQHSTAFFGYRLSKSALKKLKGWTDKDIIKALVRKGFRACIKYTATINKNTVAELVPDETLEAVGYEKIQAKEFFIEQNTEPENI